MEKKQRTGAKGSDVTIDSNGLESIEEKSKKLKILIAEDDEASSLLIELATEEIANEIIHVNNGMSAIEACLNNPDIDLILMDIQMNVLNGFEAVRQIRKFNKEVVIIAQTAFALTGSREAALDVGCNDYISKPMSLDNLMKMIQSHLKR